MDNLSPATVRDVARVAAVSPSTVSLVMNGGRAREATRLRVQDAARKLRYVPQNHGRGLRSGRSHTIGFFILNTREVDDLSSEAADFWYQLIRGTQAECKAHDYYFSFESFCWDNAGDLVYRALSRSNDGAIIVPQYRHHYTFVGELEASGYPFAMYNPWIPVGEARTVMTDDRDAQRRLTEYVLSLGHELIAFINGPRDHVDSQHRYAGYLEAHTPYRVIPDERLVRWSDLTVHGGYTATDDLFEHSSVRPTAIVCGNDYLAVGAIHSLRRRGVRVPEDVAVTGYGDHDVSRSVIPQLTTVTLPVRQIGESLAGKLFAQIGGEPDTGEVRFVPELVIREST